MLLFRIPVTSFTLSSVPKYGDIRFKIPIYTRTSGFGYKYNILML